MQWVESIAAGVTLLAGAFAFRWLNRFRASRDAAPPSRSIHDAASANDLHTLRRWLALAPDRVDACHASNETPLHRAVACGHVDAARLLIAHGADVNALGRDAETPLHLAAMDGSAAMVTLLLEAGATPGRAAVNGLTPLHLVAMRGDVDVAIKLLDAGAPVNARDDGENTALHRAAAEGHLALVSLLLERGADPTARGYNGMTPESLATLHRRADVVRLLKAHAPSGR